MRCCAGYSSTNSPNSPRKCPQPFWICRISECALYCVRTPILRIPELMQFESGKSIIRNFPPNGTAGFVRHVVRCFNRDPRPPAIINASVFLVKLLIKRGDSSLFILSQSHFQSGVAYKQDPVDGSARKLKILYLKYCKKQATSKHLFLIPLYYKAWE